MAADAVDRAVDAVEAVADRLDVAARGLQRGGEQVGLAPGPCS